MKINTLFRSVVIAALAGGMFASCNSESGYDEPEVNPNSAIKLAKAPDFILYSGGNVLANTSAVKTNGMRGVAIMVGSNYYKVQDYNADKSKWSDWEKTNRAVLYQYIDNAPAKTDRGEQVSQAEYEYVMNYLKNHPNEGGTVCNLTTYYIQNVGSSKDAYTVAFTNGSSVHHTATIIGGNQMDYFQIDGVHVNDYNASNGPRALLVDIPMVNPSYHESWGTIDQIKINAYRYYYIEYNGKTACYLCFDYQVKKWDNGNLDFQGDGVYSDWVIKLTPADGTDAVDPDKKPVDPIVEPTEPGLGNIEVNLTVNEEKTTDDYIATKLSIHVRDTSDVEVFIPVSSEYYCDKDDMYIVKSHQYDQYLYNENATSSMTYNINGTDITLTVKYEVGGIRVTTQGINADVLKYLRENYNDGLTFEVWNYFNSTITRPQLKTLLDQSTVTFTANPGTYVNAFAKIADYEKDGIDVWEKAGDDGVWRPYTDEACTQLLDQKYWRISPELEDGQAIYYYFTGEVNPWDCTVTPPAAYGNKTTDELAIRNYNVYYTM